MARFKSYPIFYSLLAVLGLAALVEVYLLIPLALPYSLARGRKEALNDLDDNLKKYAELTHKSVTPNSENLKAVEADREQAEKALAATRDYLKGKGGLAQKFAAMPVPADATASYFSIGLYRDNQLKKFKQAVAATETAETSVPEETAGEDAQTQKVKLKFNDKDAFGFAGYLHTGPDNPEIIKQVFRQTQIADYLLDALLTAKPVEFVSILREAPLTKTAREEYDQAVKEAKEKNEPPPLLTASSAAAEEAVDYFEVDPLLSNRVPGAIDTVAFQLTFIGKTSTLRDFMNKLAAQELPLKVVRIEVAQDRPAPPPPPKIELDEEGNPVVLTPDQMPKLVVASTYSKFIVTVEYVELAPLPTSP